MGQREGITSMFLHFFLADNHFFLESLLASCQSANQGNSLGIRNKDLRHIVEVEANGQGEAEVLLEAEEVRLHQRGTDQE
jgi:hypothetical protein